MGNLAKGEYEAVSPLVEELRRANIPEDLRFTIDRSMELLARSREELENTERQLRRASFHLEKGEDSEAARQLEEADASREVVRRLLDNDAKVLLFESLRRVASCRCCSLYYVAFMQCQSRFYFMPEWSDLGDSFSNGLA